MASSYKDINGRLSLEIPLGPSRRLFMVLVWVVFSDFSLGLNCWAQGLVMYFFFQLKYWNNCSILSNSYGSKKSNLSIENAGYLEILSPWQGRARVEKFIYLRSQLIIIWTGWEALRCGIQTSFPSKIVCVKLLPLLRCSFQLKKSVSEKGYRIRLL